MVIKNLIILLFLFNISYADTFEENCIQCHSHEFKFKMFMKKYTLKYSSEKNIKKAIFEYLKEPSYNKSILPFGYLRRFGIKEKTDLDNEELSDMIDIYYDKYNIKSKIY